MTRPYPYYRHTDVEWLGELPTHWEVKRLSHIASYRTSSVDKKMVVGELPVRLCNYTDVYYLERIRATDGEFMRATASEREVEGFRLRKGDVVVTKDSEDWRDIAVPALIEESAQDFVCGYHLGIIRPNRSTNPGFLFRLMQSVAINRQLQVSASGVTRYGLPRAAICKAQVPLPPTDEQRAITAFLDQETGKIDAVIEKNRQLIERLEEYRTALITRIVTRGLAPEDAVAAGLEPSARFRDSGVEWLGEVPEHWEVRSLRHICQLRYGDSLPSEARQTGCVRVFGSNGPVGHHNASNTDAPVIVIGRKGSHGKVNFHEQSVFAIDTTYFVDKLSTGADLRWLYYALLCADLGDVSMDSAVPGLSRSHAYGKRIAVPPIDEQRAIAAFLDRETERVNVLCSRVETAIERLSEYRTALVTNAVTGKIDVGESGATGIGGNGV